jgi:hypothetical protein
LTAEFNSPEKKRNKEKEVSRIKFTYKAEESEMDETSTARITKEDNESSDQGIVLQ